MKNTCKRHSKCLKKEESLNECNKKLQTLPNSILSDLTELSQLKRDQMIDNKQYQIMQFGIEERKLELLEQELTIKIEMLRAEAARKHLKRWEG